MKGVYVCFNENSGNFEEAVKISNNGYLMWRHRKRVAQELNYPSVIIVKISKKDIYYEGDLLLARDYKDFNRTIFSKDTKHRPASWRNDVDSSYKSVLFIANLREVSQPKEVKHLQPPQGFAYIEINMDRRLFQSDA